MKIEIKEEIKEEFKPIKLEITIETLGEFLSLWTRIDLSTYEIVNYFESISEDEIDDLYSFWERLDRIADIRGIKRPEAKE